MIDNEELSHDSVQNNKAGLPLLQVWSIPVGNGILSGKNEKILPLLWFDVSQL